MFYTNPFQYQPMSYQQQIQQLQQQAQQLSQQQQPQPQPQNAGSFYFVNSQKEAEDWVIGAGQTVFFFDRNNPVFYIKSVAQNGLSQPLEAYEYTQRTGSPEKGSEGAQNEFVTRDEFNALKQELEAIKEGVG